MSQYIVCRVSKQFFTVSILSTNRIIPLTDITPVPDTSEYIMGVMEAEGEVLPVIDLSQRFFNIPIKGEEAAQVIIVYWKGKEVGIAVNEVLTIRDFDESQIDNQLEKITTLNHHSDYTPIKSFIQSEEGLILELNIDNLFEMGGSLEIQEIVDNYETMGETEADKTEEESLENPESQKE